MKNHPFFIVFILSLLVLSACERSEKPILAPQTLVTENRDEKEQERIRLSVLDTASNQVTQWKIEGDYFGAFYGENIHYFIHNQPLYSVFNSPILSVSEMVVMGDLTRKRYVLEFDITTQVLSKVKNPVLIPIDSASLSLVKAGAVWNSKPDRLLNHQLSQYELRWQDEYYRYQYKHNKNTAFEPFVLTVTAHNHEDDYAQVFLSMQ